MIRVGSLFSGIEGFGLGLTMAGLDPHVAYVAERDPFALRLLARHHPDAVVYTDVRDVGPASPAVDWLVGGFPCQPVSQAGKGLAQKDDRWLWPEFARIIAETRPDVAVIENVRGLLRPNRGMGDVLADLARLGYGAQWDLIPAIAVGASHLRHRVWIVAYPESKPLGHVFAAPPFRFPFPPDPAEAGGGSRIPRLVGRMPHRRERLTALGNSVVPQVVAAVAINIVRAQTTEPFHPLRLMPDEWPTKFPNAGALVAGHIFALETSAPGKKPVRFWPTPAASETGWTLEAIKATRHADGTEPHDPHKRLYHPTTGQIVQRTLDTYVKGAAAGLWPTPTASAAGGARSFDENGDAYGIGGRGPTLLDAARALEDERPIPDRVWPTPKASPSGPDFARMQREGSGGDDLETAVVRDARGRSREVEATWPTPSASDGSGGRVSSGETRASGRRPSGAKAQRTLGDAVTDAEKTWATPSARDAKGPSGAGFLERRDGSADLAAQAGGSLNPEWVEWLMGYPIGWTNPENGGTA